MRELPKTSLISCQMAYYPIGDAAYSDAVDTVLGLIKDAGIAHETGEMSTVLKGTPQAVFTLLQNIAESMDGKYVLQLSISNVCGCTPDKP